jgi:hypothetical protein
MRFNRYTKQYNRVHEHKQALLVKISKKLMGQRHGIFENGFVGFQEKLSTLKECLIKMVHHDVANLA